MSSKEMLATMLKLFSTVWTKTITPDLTEAYSYALKKYSDDEIREAGYKCLEQCDHFPKPTEIISRIPKKESPGSLLFDTCRCSKCHEVKWCIKEDDMNGWECRECYSGLTAEEYKAKMRGIIKILESKDLNKKVGWKVETQQPPH